MTTILAVLGPLLPFLTNLLKELLGDILKDAGTTEAVEARPNRKRRNRLNAIIRDHKLSKQNKSRDRAAR